MATQLLEREIGIDYLNADFDEIENEISETDTVRIEINDGLETALTELENLQSQMSEKESATLVELCKSSVVDTITAQFGLIGVFMSAKDGGNVTTTHNFEKGVVANDADQAKHDTLNDYDRKGTGYDRDFPEKRKDAFQQNDTIYDEYTGKPLQKDRTTHLDHVVSAKEIETNARNNLHLSPEERAKMATDEANLAFTNSSINPSKGDKPLAEWLDAPNAKDPSKTNAEVYNIDRDAALEADKQARKHIKKTVDKAAFKNYSTQLLKTGGKEAAIACGGTLIGLVMRDLTQAIFEEIHTTIKLRGAETFKEVFRRFKSRLSEVAVKIKENWKGTLEEGIWSGITAFLSNIVVFVINLVATTLKKIVFMIRAGFVSLVQAIRMLAKPPEGIPADEVRYQAFKILVTGFISAGSLGLSAAIEKLLQAIPGLQPIMMFPLPFMSGKTVSDAIAVTLSALAGGLISTIVLYYMDKFRQEKKDEKIRFQLVAQNGVIVNYKIAQTWILLDDAYKLLDYVAKDFVVYMKETDATIQESGERADRAIAKVAANRSRIEKLRSLQKSEVFET
jgi:hypothetical protein